MPRFGYGASVYRATAEAVLDANEYDRKAIVADALTRKPGSKPGEHYRDLAVALKIVRLRVGPELFAPLQQRLGAYIDQQEDDRDSRRWVSMYALTDPALFQWWGTREWAARVCCRIYGYARQVADLDHVEMQAARQPAYTFLALLAVLDERDLPGWREVRAALVLPERQKQTVRDGTTRRGMIRPQAKCVALQYPGNKRALARPVMKMLDLPQGATLVEPFCGTAAVSLTVKAHRPDVKIRLNDKKRAVVAFHKTLRDDPDFMIERLHNDKPDREKHERYRQAVLADEGDEKALGWMLYYLTMYSFRGFGIVFSTSTAGTLANREESLRRNSRLLQGATITHGDFREVMRRVKRGQYIYLDPPYRGTEVKLYAPFTNKDREDLLCCLLRASVAGKRFVLSDDNPDQTWLEYGDWTEITECRVRHRDPEVLVMSLAE